MKIYSLVEKSYDWHEFERFYESTTDLSKILKIIKEQDFKDWDDNLYEVLYNDKEKDRERMGELRGSETDHWCIYVNEENSV